MRYLVASGGATHSLVALTFGAHLAASTDAALTVVTVIKREDERAQARLILDRARLVLDPLSIDFDTVIRVGHPAEEILAEAESGRYSLVILGEKQHHRFTTRFLLGSTALRVVEHAPCPAVIVKGQVGPVTKLLICDSGVGDEPLIDRFTAQLPGLLEAVSSISVLHVMSQIGATPSVPGERLRTSDVDELMAQHALEGEILRHDVDVLARTGHPARAKIRHGRVVDEILAEAREGNYDLVVIGAHRGTGWRRILLDDVAHQIVVGLDRPVLVVR